MHKIDADFAGAGKGAARWWGAAGGAGHAMGDAFPQRIRRVDQAGINDRRAAHVGHAMRADGVENRRRLHPPQAHIGAGQRRDRPRKAPAVAMEHRHHPEIHGVPAHIGGKNIVQRIQVGAAMVRHHALGVAGGAGRVIQRNRVPFVRRQRPLEFFIAFRQERFVFDRADKFAAARAGIVDVDDERPFIGRHKVQCVSNDRAVFAVGQQKFGGPVPKLEGERCGIEPGIERIDHGTGHRNAEMRFHHGQRVRCHDGDRIAAPDAALLERGGEAPAPRVGFYPALRSVALHDSGALRVEQRGLGQEAQRRQRHVVGRSAL